VGYCIDYIAELRVTHVALQITITVSLPSIVFFRRLQRIYIVFSKMYGKKMGASD
jgi:hypothetical protein